MKLIFFYIFIIILNFNILSYANILTWESCVKTIKTHHPKLQQATERIIQTKHSKDKVTSQLYPQLSFSSSLDDDINYSSGISAKQLIYDGNNTQHQVQQSTYDLVASNLEYQTLYEGLLYNLRIAFINLWKSQKLIDILEIITKRRKQNLDLVQLRYQAGREHYGSFLNAKTKHLQAISDLKQAKRVLNLNKQQLNQAMGLPINKPLYITLNIQNPSSSKKITPPNFQELVLKHYDYQLWEIQNKSAQLAIKIAKTDHLPQINAQMNSKISGSDQVNSKGSISAGLNLTLLMLDGGKKEANIKQKQSKLRETDLNKQVIKDQLLLKMKESWIAYQNKLDQKRIDQEFLKSSEERAKISEAQYSAGLISFDNWTIIEDELVKIRKNNLIAQAETLLAQATYYYDLGGTQNYEN